LADESHPAGHHLDEEIAELVGLCKRQVVRIRQQFVRQGVKPTLARKVRATPPRPYKFDGRAEARLVALCCSTPPAGRERWTLSLLVEELRRLQVVTSVCPETVRRCLKKIALNPGARNGSAFRKGIGPDLWRTWRKSSMSTAKSTTHNLR
jgi:hypothetical protein